MVSQDVSELINKKFNKLTVVEYVGRRGKWQSRYFLCQCDCGKKKVIRMTDFKTGRSTSCGCVQKEKARVGSKKMKLAFGVSPTNTLYAQYRKSAEDRKFSFDISRDFFKSTIAKNCHYCGCEPSSFCRNRYFPETDFVIYNGIDRKDSKIGYVESNCVPCCSACNYAKSDMDEEKFLDLIARIYYHRENEISNRRKNL